jgi:hypothetical protein
LSGVGGRAFGDCALGDARRTRRLVEVAAAFGAGACCGGGGTITGVITDTHQAKAAYRLLDCPAVTHDSVLGGHVQWVGRRLTEAGTYLLIEDTTTLAYRGREQGRSLGPIGESATRGFWLHSTLALRWEESADACEKPSDACEILGLAAQQAWARPQARPAGRRKSHGRGKESNHARQSREDRESGRWALALGGLPVAGDDVERIYVADRESDIYEVFEACRSAGVSHVIRAAHRRALAEESEGLDLMTAASEGVLLGEIHVHVPRENRTATVRVRGVSVELRGPPRPGGRLADHTLNIASAGEVDPPEGCTPLNWTLLTDLPVATLEQCVRVIRVYRCRWLIEEFHKAMKTGLNLEQSQLSDYRRLSSLAGIVSVVAVVLLQTKWAARTRGEEKINETSTDATMLKVLAKVHPPKGPPTRRWFWISVARLGGFPARKGDGHPGWLTLWRGWQTLIHMTRGYELNGT